MKTTFGRLFGTAAAILLAALLLLGTFFQVLVKDYLVTNTTEKLTTDAQTIAELAAAYNADSSLSNPNFLTNLIISSRISGADAVICNAEGKVVLCSDSPLGCEHHGMSFDKSFVVNVMDQELVIKTGRIDPKRVCMTCGKCGDLIRAHKPTGCVVRDPDTFMPFYREFQEIKKTQPANFRG